MLVAKLFHPAGTVDLLLNIPTMFGGSISPVTYRERRPRSTPGFSDSRKAFMVRFQVLEGLVQSLRSSAAWLWGWDHLVAYGVNNLGSMKL